MGKSRKVTVGHKYYLGEHIVLCHGPIDSINYIKVDNKVAWLGNATGGSITIDAETLFGGSKRDDESFGDTNADNSEADGISGTVDVLMGGPTQTRNSYLQSVLGALIPAFRGVVSLVLRQVYIGNSPSPKSWVPNGTRIHKTDNGAVQWYDEKAEIATGIATATYSKTIDFDANGDGVNGALRYQGITVFADPADVLVVTKNRYADGGLFRAWSVWPPGGPWQNTVYVRKGGSGGPVEIHWSGDYATEALAEDHATGSFTLTGYSQYSFNVYDDLYSDNRGGLSLKITQQKIQRDMNGAHIIRECYVSKDKGLAWPESEINDTAFRAAADRLYDEGMGLSFLWDRQKPINEFIDEIKRHIDADVYRDRDGLLTIKLIRDDYDIDDLPVFDNSNIIRIEHVASTPSDELINTVNASYWDCTTGKTASIPVSDPALVQRQGRVNATPVQYPCFTNAAITTRKATLDLRVLSNSLFSFRIVVNREGEGLEIGSRFILNRPDVKAFNMVVRVLDVNEGDGLNNEITLSVTQDVFALPNTQVVAPSTVKWEDPRRPAEASPARLVFELPYYELVQYQGQTDVDAELLDEPSLALVGIAAVRPNGTSLDAQVIVDDSGTYHAADTLDYCPSALLTAAITKTQTNITFDNGVDLDLVSIGSHAQIGSELVVVNALDRVAGTAIIGRGVLDTLPAAHADNDRIFFWDAFVASDSTSYISGETVNVKVLTNSTSGRLAASEAPVDSVTFVGRAARPYPPGNFKVNGVAFGSSVGATSDITFSWAHRDRTQQTAATLQDTTYGNIGPEAGATYTLRIYNQFNTLIRTQSGMTGTSYVYTTAQEQIDNGGGGGASAVVEPYWTKTSLLLNFNGVNGSTTFTNSAGVYLTPFGNVQITTAQHKYGSTCAAFDGNGDYLTAANPNSGFTFTSGDFTVEFWLYIPATVTATQTIFDKGGISGSTYPHWNIALTASRTIQAQLGRAQGSQSANIVTSTTTLALNTWHHVQWVRTGSLLKLFINGVQEGGSISVTVTPLDNTQALYIGWYSGAPTSSYFNGYLADVRITKGTARNTTNFTPPQNQLGKYVKDANFSDNKLALIFEGDNGSTSIIDRSDVGQLVSVFGNAKISTAQFKFGSSSLDLDGASNSFISAPFNTAYTGTSDLTLECYIRTSDVARSGTIACTTLLATASTRAGWVFGMDFTARLFAQAWTAAGALAFTIYPTNTLSANTWYHVALVRNGTNWTIYLDGTAIGSATESAAIGVSGDALYIGRDQNTLITWLGQIDDFRVRSGAKYTSNFSVPSTSFLPIDSAWANTALLLNFFGGNGSTTFEDSSEYGKALTVFGNSVLSTAQYKYGGAAGYFDGSGDYLTLPSITFDADFTIETWVYIAANSAVDGNGFRSAALFSNSNAASILTYSFYLTGNGTTTGTGIGWYMNNANSGVSLTSSGTISQNAWHHVAVSRSGTTTKLFVDGVMVASSTLYAGLAGNTSYNSGVGSNVLANTYVAYLNGYLDDMRVTKGAARYTADFTPPAKELSKYISALNTQLRIELETERAGLKSYQKYDHIITRAA